MQYSPTTRRQFLAATAAGCALPTLLAAAEKQSTPKEVPWLAKVQQPPTKLPDDAPRLSPLLVDGQGNKITSLAAWQKHRPAVRQWWLDFLGTMNVQRKGVPKLEVLQEDRVDGVIRQRVRYQIEPGMTTQAYLLKPAKTVRPRPGVAVFHSTVNHSIRQPAGVQGVPEKAFGLTLAKRGYVTFCPRNYLWPTNDKISARGEAENHLKRHPKSKGMAKMLYNAQVAVDILAALPEVDSQRLGAVGHSLGAKEVLYLAALDQRIKVTVSSEGGVGTKFSNWDAAWYLGPTIKQPSFDREQHELLALAAPRAFLLLGGDSADGDRSWPFITEALKVYKLHGNTPRLGLFNHKKGHAVPPEAERKIYEWIEAYL